MLAAFFSRQIDKFERDWSYDATYMRDLLKHAGPIAFFKFMLLTTLGRGKTAPPAALAAAGVVGTLAEDCGPCTQISVDLAAAGGVSPTVLRAILAGDEAAMGEDARLGYQFARAVLDRDMERADPLRDEVVRRWGHRGLTDIGLGLMSARLYPTLKYALGHGKTCSRVVVAGESAPFRRPELLAA